MDKDFKYWVLGTVTVLILIGMIIMFNKNKYYVIDSQTGNFFSVVNTNTGEVTKYTFR